MTGLHDPHHCSAAYILRVTRTKLYQWGMTYGSGHHLFCSLYQYFKAMSRATLQNWLAVLGGGGAPTYGGADGARICCRCRLGCPVPILESGTFPIKYRAEGQI